MVQNYAQGNATIYDSDFNAILNIIDGFAIKSGCSISKGSGDWDIDVTSGTVYIPASNDVSVSSGTVTLTQPSNDADMGSGDSRIDLITADTSGTLAAVEGTAATNPDSPDIPSNEVLLGFVFISNGDSTLADSDINDIPALALVAESVSALSFSDTWSTVDATSAANASDGDTGTGTSIESDGTTSIGAAHGLFVDNVRVHISGTDNSQTIQLRSDHPTEAGTFSHLHDSITFDGTNQFWTFTPDYNISEFYIENTNTNAVSVNEIEVQPQNFSHTHDVS